MTTLSIGLDSDALRSLGRPKTYTGEYLSQIAFPLGGIGAGCVSLSGRGSLVDWEIFNRPNKGSLLPYTFFTLWAKEQDKTPVTRVLQAPPNPPFTGVGSQDYAGLGFGISRMDGSGFPQMRKAEFMGEFPYAWIRFVDPVLPVQVRLAAHSPFIPLNPDESGMPIAVLRYTITNTQAVPVEVSLAGNLYNAVGYPGTGHFDGKGQGQNVNAYYDQGNVRGLSMTSNKYETFSRYFGSMALSTTWQDVGYQSYWLRGPWYDSMHSFWDHFAASGELPAREYGPSDEGKSDVGSLWLRANIAPGESVTLPIFISWYMPNFCRYWDALPNIENIELPTEPVWKNYYASLWTDAKDVARHYAENDVRLDEETRRFHAALFSSKLPAHVLDAVSSQASTLHTPTVVRLEDGTFYGFEGCCAGGGCCQGSCTHVWNYAQTQAFLFPSLERSMRSADYTYNLRKDGHMSFRLQLPLGSPMHNFHAAADGQMGGLIKLYRDWKLSGDDVWLAEQWPKAQQALEFAWQQWDANKDGVMEGTQHNTYDIEFEGPNTMTGTCYLGALLAGSHIADYLGDQALANEYLRLYENGRKYLDARLFNGEYYEQEVDASEARYQYGKGCLSDQLLGQWMARIAGLGPMLDPAHEQAALASIFRYNWKTDFWEHANPQRIFALNDEQGLTTCSWPHGERPALPFVYSDEVFCGIEYQVASHLIYCGMVDEGLAIAQGVRARHDGKRRNPWNEFECGSHYARSIASWGLLTALSGMSYDATIGYLGFDPVLYADDFKCFWSTGTAWGTYEQSGQPGNALVKLEVLYGEQLLKALGTGFIAAGCTATVDGQSIPCSPNVAESSKLIFSKELNLERGSVLTITLA